MQIPDTSDIVETNNLLTDLIDHLHTLKVEIEAHQRFLEVQCVKYAFHSSTMLGLFAGTQIQNVRIPDLNSIFLIFRAQLEAYLMFYYLNVDNVDVNEKELRLLLFEASGLKHRQKFKVSTDKHKQQRSGELKRLEDLKSKIITNVYFQNFESTKQTKLLKDLPSRMFGWIELIKRSDLKDEFFIDMWSLCSNYAHSEYLSLIQFKGYMFDMGQLTTSLTQILRNSIILTTIMCYDLLRLFPALVPFYNENAFENLDRLDKLNTMGRKVLMHTDNV